MGLNTFTEQSRETGSDPSRMFRFETLIPPGADPGQAPSKCREVVLTWESWTLMQNRHNRVLPSTGPFG